MALRTKADYIESLNAYRPNVFINGKKTDSVRDSFGFKTAINQIGVSYDISFDPAYRDRSVVTSSLTGEKIQRNALHIQGSAEDAITKAALTRELTKKYICTFCLSNFLSVTWAFLYDVDRAYGTDYFLRFKDFVTYLQKNDLRAAWGMMDPKGDRSLRPSAQKRLTDLRITKKNKDGIVVSGAKLHTTCGPVMHEVMAVPCRALTKEEQPFAVSFAVPVDTKGITFICRPAPGPKQPVDTANPLSSKYVGVEAMTVFEDVFIPWDRVFLCGEWDMCATLPSYFASLHRQSKCACSAGHADLMAGTCALLARVNGLSPKTGHISDKITDIAMAAETAYGCAVGSAATGEKHPSGVWLPNALTANSGLNHIRSSLGSHISHIHDIAGGLLTTMPGETDINNPATLEMIDLYLAGGDDYTTGQRLRAMELARDLAASNLCGAIWGFTINAAGSPAASRILVSRQYNLDEMERTAERIAGIR